MSDGESDTPVQGTWLTAWLIGAAVPALIGTVLLMAFIAVISARAGQPLQFAQYLGGAANIFVYAALAAAFTAALLIGPMMLAESHRPRTLGLWLTMGLIATGPAALMAWLISNIRIAPQGTPPPLLSETLPAPLILLVLGLIGTAAAYRVRHGSWQ